MICIFLDGVNIQHVLMEPCASAVGQEAEKQQQACCCEVMHGVLLLFLPA